MRTSRQAWPWVLTLVSALSSPPAFGQFGLMQLLNPGGSRLFPELLVIPRHPGKPDPRWRRFDWQFLDTESDGVEFRLYFYPEEKAVVEMVLPRIRDQIHQLRKRFGFRPQRKFNYVLFTSRHEFHQANVFYIAEGVQGITSTTEATLAVPYWGERKTFDHISHHELVHEFQVQGALEQGGRGLALFPLWFVEGMAEYYSLGGMDSESKMYVRDLLWHARSREERLPRFFEQGALSFLSIYKLGQAKIEFLEEQFGKGTAHQLFLATSQEERQAILFSDIVVRELKLDEATLEKRWEQYLKESYFWGEPALGQPPEIFDQVAEAGLELDYFDVSPSGYVMGLRERDSLSGVVSIELLDRLSEERRLRVIEDRTPRALTLYLLQGPTLSVTDEKIAFAVGTSRGPEIEVVSLARDAKKRLQLGHRLRLPIASYGILEIGPLALSPDNTALAFVGLALDGRQSVYLSRLGKEERPVRLTQGPYSFVSLSWSSSGILVASDKNTPATYDLFRLDPQSGAMSALTHGTADELAPKEDKGDIFFHSWKSGSAQVHALRADGTELQLTRSQTGFLYPKRAAGELYALGLWNGKFRLFHITHRLRDEQLPQSKAQAFREVVWKPEKLDVLESHIQRYRYFLTDTRVDYLTGFLSGGAAAGLATQVSDRLRDYAISVEALWIVNLGIFNGTLLFSSQRGRSSWVTGAYHSVRRQVDSYYQSDNKIRYYRQREYGLVGAIQYPLSPFSYIELGGRVGGVERSEFSDSTLAADWNRRNPGLEPVLAPAVRLGYDRIHYEAFTGPLKGFGVLLESETEFFPVRGELSERLRLDGAYYLQLFGRTILAFQALAGATWARTFRNPFYLLSDDILRGYPFGDERLLGNYFVAGRVELRFPLTSFIGFPPLRGIFSADYGSVFRRGKEFSERLASSYSAGVALNLPPLAINFLLSYPIRLAPGPLTSPVFHFTVALSLSLAKRGLR